MAANIKVKMALIQYNIKQYELAEKLGMAEATLSRKLRQELPENIQASYVNAVEELANEISRNYGKLYKNKTVEEKLIFVDYSPSNECKNKNVISTCYKCGACGRVFKNGVIVNNNETTYKEINT